MPPAVALAHPDKLFRTIEEIHEHAAGIIYEGVALLVNDGSCRPRLSVHGYHSQDLVTALVVEKAKLR